MACEICNDNKEKSFVVTHDGTSVIIHDARTHDTVTMNGQPHRFSNEYAAINFISTNLKGL